MIEEGDPEYQPALRLAHLAIKAGRFKRPTTPLCPALAGQIAEFRSAVAAEVHLLSVTNDTAFVLVVPAEGDLFTLQFSAATNVVLS